MGVRSDNCYQSDTYEFDVALSFAGENRTFVAQVAERLKSHGMRVFYDEDYRAQLWGEDLVTYLDEVYRKRSRFTILFISRHYVTKNWTNHERKSVQARAFADDEVTLLPVQLDDTTLPGLKPTIGYIDGRINTPESLADLFAQKFGPPGPQNSADSQTSEWPVPHTLDAMRNLFEARPDCWEYLAFAGWLRMTTDELEEQYRDYEIGYAPDSGKYFETNEEAVTYLSVRLMDVDRLVRNLERVYSNTAQEAAFGPVGEPGNPDRIEHLAKRTTQMYGDMLRLVSEIRGTGRPDICDDAFEYGAKMLQGPIDTHRNYVTDFESQIVNALRQMREGEHIRLTFRLAWDIDPEITKGLSNSLKRVRAARR
jgi:hypothetical protein